MRPPPTKCPQHHDAPRLPHELIPHLAAPRPHTRRHERHIVPVVDRLRDVRGHEGRVAEPREGWCGGFAVGEVLRGRVPGVVDGFEEGQGAHVEEGEGEGFVFPFGVGRSEGLVLQEDPVERGGSGFGVGGDVLLEAVVEDFECLGRGLEWWLCCSKIAYCKSRRVEWVDEYERGARLSVACQSNYILRRHPEPNDRGASGSQHSGYQGDDIRETKQARWTEQRMSDIRGNLAEPSRGIQSVGSRQHF